MKLHKKNYFVFSILLLFHHAMILPVVGVLDTSFSGDGKVTTDIGSGTTDMAYACAVQPDGKIVVVGSSGSSMAIVRYTITGVLDNEFSSDGIVTQAIGTNAIAYGVAIQNDGKIVVCGTSDSHFFVARFLSNGSLDTAGFNTATGYIIQTIGTTDAAYAVAINPFNQKIVVVGSSDTKILVAQYTTAGVLDTGSFNTGVGTNGYNIALGPDGTSNVARAVAFDSSYRIVISGSSGAGNMIVARYLAAGTLDTAGFNNGVTNGYNLQTLGGSAPVGYGVAFQSTGKIIVAGTDGTNAAVARFTTAGVLDSGASAFGTGGTPIGYNVSNTFGGTSAIGYGVSVQSDDTIVIGGVAINATTLSDFVIARYLANGSALDTTFNPSAGYTTTDFGTNTVDVGRGLAIQSNGRFIVPGTTGSGLTDFATARYLGSAAPQGCIDVTYPASLTGVDIPGYKTYPTDTTATNLPKVVAMYPAASGNLYTLTSQSGSTNTQLVELSSTGSVTSSAVVIAKPTPSDVITDSYDRALVVGTGASNGWIARYYNNAGTMAIDSAFNSGAVADVGSSSSLMRVCEQSSGRIVAIGQSTTASTGIVIGFTSTGSVDTSFGYSGTPSYNPVSNALFKDMIIDSNDGIYIAYQYTTGGQQNIYIAKFLANGSGIDTSFASSWSGQANSGLPYASYTTPCLSFDTAGNIVLTAVEIATGNINIQVWAPTGTGWPAPTPSVIAQTTNLLSTPVITKLQCDTNNRLIFTGYDANDFFVGRCGAGVYTLDTTFAPYSSTRGLLKTMYNTTNPTDSTTPKRVSNSVGISSNGAILFGGYEAIDSTHTVSVVGQVVGDTTPYTQVDRYPGADHIGMIDTTFGTSGALSLTSVVASGSPQALYVLPSGKSLIAIDTGADTVLAQLTTGYALDTAAFGSGTGKITLTGFATPKKIMVDAAGNIYIVGNNAGGTASILKKLTSTGSAVTWTASTNVTLGNIVRQQANGRIILAGSDGSGGVIVGYNSVTGAIDTTFGVNGYYQTGVASQVMGASITTSDKIVFVYRDGSGNAIVQRLLENGNLDTTFAFGTALTSVASDTSVQLQLDVNGKIIVVALNSSNNYIARRYLATGANDVSTVTVVPTAITAPALRDILSLSDGTTIVLGIDSGGRIEAFRFTTAFAQDMTFNDPVGFLETTVASMTNFYAFDVTSYAGILVTGVTGTTPYLTSIINGAVTKANQNISAVGTPGTINTNFGTSGAVSLGALGAGTPLAGLTPQVVLPTTTGQYYIAFTSGVLARLTNGAVLDTTFDTDGLASSSSAGVQSMIIDGSNRLTLAGTTGGAGWVKRYNAGLGTLDTTFNTTVATSLTTLDSAVATTIAQQTIGRYIVAGQVNSGSKGALFAFTNTGAIDTTFNSNGTISVGGTTPGIFNTGIASAIYACAVDQYDRLIIAYKNGSNIDVVRLTSAGQLDTQFNSAGTFSSAIAGADDATQVRIVVDYAGNVIVVAHTSSGISVRGLTTAGASLYAQLDISTIITSTPVLTNLIATADGNVLLSGYQATTSAMWVARLTVAGALDLTFGGGDGIMTFSFDGVANPRRLNSIAMYGDGEIAMVGTETNGTVNPFLAMAYDTPYTIQVSQSPASKTIGTNDVTLGASSTTATNLGVTFFASTATLATAGQVARANALQDQANIVVAVDGGAANGSATPSQIFLKMFTIDGTPNTAFGTDGQQTVLTTYQNQFVQDMVTFTTVAGINKAILAGYVTNTTLGTTSSLLLQYNLTTPAVDVANFGGFNGNPAGIAFGDGKQINSVGLQSTGRIIAAGISQDMYGLLLGYTSAGKLDKSFGTDGYLAILASTGIYTHAIDSKNRIVVAYQDSDTQAVVARYLANGLIDTTFAGGAITTDRTTYGNNGIRAAVDSSNNVFIAVVADDYSAIQIFSYGAADGSTLYASLTLSSLSLTHFVISKLLIDVNGKVIIVGYDTNGGSADQIVIVRLLANISGLDTTFNPSPAAIPGCLKYAVAGGLTQIANDAFIHPDGTILIAGAKN